MSLADFARHVKLEEKHADEKKILPTEFPHGPASASKDLGRALNIDRYWKRDPLACAIQGLYLEHSTEDAIKRMCFNNQTADEEALQQLSSRSREFIPALAELRSKAIDRAVMHRFSESQAAESSEGESSEFDFAISASDGEGAGRREKDFLLPPGWYTEKFRRQSREVREFVDPTGRRYRTASDARQAIDSARARDNINQRLKAKYGGVLNERVAVLAQ
jgi:hypothetical protein